MKKTKYLYDENVSPAGMVSVSQIQTFMSCPKKWEYNYIEDITPRVERAYLTIGKLCHKGMQVAMQNLWKDQKAGLDTTLEGGLFKSWLYSGLSAMRIEFDAYMVATSLLDEEIPDVEQILVDAESVFSQAFEEFEPWKYEVVTLCDEGKPIPALELHFCVPCGGANKLHGYIDAILREKETGFIWCTDYKFRRSLSPDEEEAVNIQNAVYSYACKKMEISITGTMTWQHVNTPAADPAILKDGRISRAKIKTTWKHYEAFLRGHGEDPDEYREEMCEKLGDIEWYRATHEYRNDGTVMRMWEEIVVPAAREINRAYKRVNLRYMYPWNCKMCQYKDLCQAELRDHDAEHLRTTQYTKRERARDKDILDNTEIPEV